MQKSSVLVSTALLWISAAPLTAQTAGMSPGPLQMLEDHTAAIINNRLDCPDEFNLLADKEGGNGVTLTYSQGSGELTTANYAGARVENSGGAPSVENPDWYILDFNTRVELERITFQWEAATLPLDYTLSVSDSGNDWAVVATVSRGGQDGNYDNFRLSDPEVSVAGRYLRLTITRGQNAGYHPRIDLWRVQSRRLPASLELTSTLTSPQNQSDGWTFFYEAGLSATVRAVVKDRFGNVMNPIRAIDMLIEGDSDGSIVRPDGHDGVYVYTPSEGFTGNVTFTSSCGDVSDVRTITVIDESKYYTFGATAASSTAPTEQKVGNLFDGTAGRDASGSVYTFAADGQTEDADHSITVTLQRPVTVDALRLYWGGAPKVCTVSVSTDGETFTEVGGSTHSDVGNFWEAFGNINRIARYIKIDTQGYAVMAWGLKLGEIKIYGDCEESVPTAIEISSTGGTALAKGESTTFSAEVIDQYGSVIPGCAVTWSHTEISGTWDEETLTYTAGDHVATEAGVTFTASFTDGARTVTAEILIKGFDIDHYVFDASLHEDYRDTGIDLAAEAAASVVASTNNPAGRPDAALLFDGGKELKANGGGYRFLIVGSDRDSEGQIIVRLHDPVVIEAIILRWERACPSEYTVELSNDGRQWGQVARYTNINPDGDEFFNHRMCVRYDRPVTYIRVTTNGLNTGWGAQLMDFKVYGTYADVEPAALTLKPYVKVAYTTGSDENERTVINDHPNTVVFFSEEAGGRFSEETVYLNPVFLTANGAELRVRDRRIDYVITEVGGAAMNGSGGYELDAVAHTVKFKEAGTFRVEAFYTGHDNNTVTAEIELKAVHHNYMLTSAYSDVAVTLVANGSGDREHQDAARAKEILMSGRTDRDGGVEGSVNLFSNGELYDVVFDFGTVIDIPAVEIYWEGACPERYTLTVSRDDADSSASYEHYDPNRRAMVDRPRFDRFAIEVPPYSRRAAAVARAADDAGKEPQDGSTMAIRYAKLHIDALDPWMGGVWGAKLAEVTPYFDPETTGTLPTGIVNVGTDIDAAAPVEYYNLQGVRVDTPAAGQIMIRRQGASVSKIMVR